VYKTSKGKRVKYQEYLGHRNGVFHLVLNEGAYELEISQDKSILGVESVDINSDLIWRSIKL
jgi:hypothetical protein